MVIALGLAGCVWKYFFLLVVGLGAMTKKKQKNKKKKSRKKKKKKNKPNKKKKKQQKKKKNKTPSYECDAVFFWAGGRSGIGFPIRIVGSHNAMCPVSWTCWEKDMTDVMVISKGALFRTTCQKRLKTEDGRGGVFQTAGRLV